ncbi:hypothetical protein [Stenotrophomonas maltophilia]|uniref:hypothetical protein n=1 Tax=Stenotrophomonas maltophilia TaxID=40324 RepID=UPI0011B3D298|nr:hypothetical protein [Stenotrophomonas maltophilia]
MKASSALMCGVQLFLLLGLGTGVVTTAHAQSAPVADDAEEADDVLGTRGVRDAPSMNTEYLKEFRVIANVRVECTSVEKVAVCGAGTHPVSTKSQSVPFQCKAKSSEDESKLVGKESELKVSITRSVPTKCASM